MRIGIGLPNTVPGVGGAGLVDWARRAEERGFSTLGTIGRVAWPGYEELVALTAAAVATGRIELMTNILLAPTRDPVLLAKQTASLDQLAGGRLVLGLGVGVREDDFTATGTTFADRGRRMDATLDLLQRAWRGEPVAGSAKPIGPPLTHPDGIPILIGGGSVAAIARVVRWGAGWTSGGGGPEMTAAAAAKVRAAWQAAGRAGAPRIVALQYFALGPHAETGSAAYLRDYYGAFPFVEATIKNLTRTPALVRDIVSRFADAGVDEVIFGPTIAEPDQVDRLADSAFAQS
jgi:alkanesulfonate monooxygenase SsuD/methylene tetrahydromethanopterin reductase-like flavin-dependent oxidoreductase (luciferase family)